MDYQLIVDAYERISATTRRTEMTGILVNVLQQTPLEMVDKVVYLTEGKLYPDWAGVEMGLAERLAQRAVAQTVQLPEDEVHRDLARTGDLGLTTQRILSAKGGKPSRALTAEEVYRQLDEVARTSGKGAITRKVTLLSSLLHQATPEQAKYVVRTATGKLRLGVGDMTILDALALAYTGGGEARPEIERAYNLCSDLGRVTRALATGGIEAVRQLGIQVGEPIRPMLAERLRAPSEVLEKMGGRCAAEYKYDGERIQAHKKDREVLLFSRRLENITDQYPDAAALIRDQVKAKEAILEAECVAVDADTGELRPFQYLMHRKRKYRIEEAMAEYPVHLYAFDLLRVDGRDLTRRPYVERRQALASTVTTSPRFRLSDSAIVEDEESLERFFERAVEDGCEGVVCKSLAPSSVYQAGARGWLWIKYKREYVAQMADTVDLVVVGGLYGRGKRAGTFGALLMAAYDKQRDTFCSLTKVGSGFTDKDLEELPKQLAPYRSPHKHPRVDARLVPDVWFVPALVLEVTGAEMTLSPIHTCALGEFRRESGLAIRFPRFTGRYRTDKGPEDTTTVEELREMYLRRMRKAA